MSNVLSHILHDVRQLTINQHKKLHKEYYMHSSAWRLYVAECSILTTYHSPKYYFKSRFSYHFGFIRNVIKSRELIILYKRSDHAQLYYTPNHNNHIQTYIHVYHKIMSFQFVNWFGMTLCGFSAARSCVNGKTSLVTENPHSKDI